MRQSKANLKQGDLIEPGFNSNYGQRKNASLVKLTATLEAATWSAELAVDEGRGRRYWYFGKHSSAPRLLSCAALSGRTRWRDGQSKYSKRMW